MRPLEHLDPKIPARIFAPVSKFSFKREGVSSQASRVYPLPKNDAMNVVCLDADQDLCEGLNAVCRRPECCL